MAVKRHYLRSRIADVCVSKINRNTAKREFFMAKSKSYYAAANTANGFLSLFGEIFSPAALSRIYIIKGGPGTGKSTFMYGIGKAAKERGLETEYYYCSADTGSLDGVKIPELAAAVIDGTDFGADVEVRFAIKRDKAEELLKKISEAGYGRDIPKLVGSRFDCR